LKTTNAYYRVNPSDICFIRYVFEAHDGIAVITTLSTEKDTIAVRMAPGCEDEVRQVVSGLRGENIMMEERTLETDLIEL
jgi:hypothetical protein